MRASGSAVLIASLLAAGSARAQGQDSSGAAKAAAETLFQEGRKLMAEGRAAEACPKFADSEHLDPSVSTVLNLANCYEKTGRTASAWATYREGVSAASAAGRRDLQATAQRHADTLFPSLPRLKVTVSTPEDGLAVKLDGIDVGKPQWGVAVPVDPGSHEITAVAPQYKPWSTKVTAGHEGSTLTVAVPALEALPPEVVTPPPTTAQSTEGSPSGAEQPATTRSNPPPELRTWSNQRVIAVMVGAVGVVGLGVSAVFAATAKSRYSDSLTNCHTDNTDLCNQAGYDQRQSARQAGDIATYAVAAGGAAVVIGVLLWVTGAPAPAQKAGIEIVPTLGGGMVRGRW